MNNSAAEKKKILVTGASGLLGSNLCFCWRERHEILGLYLHHPWSLAGIETRQTDLLDRDKIRSVIDEFEPDVILHSAAIANVDQAQDDRALTQETNVTATGIIADLVASRGIKLVYISTDLVFDGLTGGYRETDPVNPVNFYGLTKLKGEEVVSKVHEALIARTNFYGWNVRPNKPSLAEWVLRELKAGKTITGFYDALCSMMYTFTLADLLEKAILKNLSGIYHFASRDAMSKYDFACLLAEKMGVSKSLIVKGSIGDFPFRAPRAKNLSLNTSKLATALNIKIPEVRESLNRFWADLQGKNIP